MGELENHATSSAEEEELGAKGDTKTVNGEVGIEEAMGSGSKTTILPENKEERNEDDEEEEQEKHGTQEEQKWKTL